MNQWINVENNPKKAGKYLTYDPKYKIKTRWFIENNVWEKDNGDRVVITHYMLPPPPPKDEERFYYCMDYYGKEYILPINKRTLFTKMLNECMDEYDDIDYDAVDRFENEIGKYRIPHPISWYSFTNPLLKGDKL